MYALGRATLTVAVAGVALSTHSPAPLRVQPVPVAEEWVLAPPEAVDTAQLRALGERIYTGKVGGALCASCHGHDGRGVPALGPDLTDRQWLHGDGSLEFLRTIISTGVAKPRKSGVPMPPYGGVPLTPEQLEALATYVYTLRSSVGR
jgi:mono/diheme cytochrome c family protein